MSKASILIALIAIFLNTAAGAQTYPDRPVTMIVPFAPGGATDVIARILADGMSKRLGKGVLIENVSGAGGTTGSRRAMAATPDGYTLLIGHMGTHASSFSLYAKPHYDPRSDFEPVGLVASAPIVLFARPNYPAEDLKTFIAEVRRAGDGAVGAHSGVGSNAHLTCALLGSLIGASPRAAIYRGNGPLMTDLVAGTVDYSCDQIITVAPHVAGAKVKGLAIAGAARSSLMPNVPTFAEAGLPQFNADAWTALFAPKGIPDQVIATIHRAFVEALDVPQVRERLAGLGAIVPTPEMRKQEYLRKLVAEEVSRWGKVIENAKIPRLN